MNNQTKNLTKNYRLILNNLLEEFAHIPTTTRKHALLYDLFCAFYNFFRKTNVIEKFLRPHFYMKSFLDLEWLKNYKSLEQYLKELYINLVKTYGEALNIMIQKNLADSICLNKSYKERKKSNIMKETKELYEMDSFIEPRLARAFLVTIFNNSKHLRIFINSVCSNILKNLFYMYEKKLKYKNLSCLTHQDAKRLVPHITISPLLYLFRVVSLSNDEDFFLKYTVREEKLGTTTYYYERILLKILAALHILYIDNNKNICFTNNLINYASPESVNDFIEPALTHAISKKIIATHRNIYQAIGGYHIPTHFIFYNYKQIKEVLMVEEHIMPFLNDFLRTTANFYRVIISKNNKNINDKILEIIYSKQERYISKELHRILNNRRGNIYFKNMKNIIQSTFKILAYENYLMSGMFDPVSYFMKIPNMDLKIVKELRWEMMGYLPYSYRILPKHPLLHRDLSVLGLITPNKYVRYFSYVVL